MGKRKYFPIQVLALRVLNLGEIDVQVDLHGLGDIDDPVQVELPV
jgi:hypothetical protein